ncbi:MAG TPA: EamA family transporter [Nitrospirota bacterium]|nr:EamA family transporter [Nitrospirota bacterium]
MSWVFYALITALSIATADAISKKALIKSNEYVIAWVRQGYSLPFLVIAFFFIDIPPLDSTFWLTLLIAIPLDVTAIILYIKAIRISPLSLTIPFIALSPVFVIITAFVILGELPDISGLIGILLIVTGAYLLNVRATRHGVLGPIMAIRREKGSVLMIIVAGIFSLTSTLGKVAVMHSSPLFFGAFYPFILTGIFTVIAGLKGQLSGVITRPWIFLGIGFCMAVMMLTHYVAISLTDVAYMISVKRCSLLFSVIYGWLLFREISISERFIGAVLMIAGVVAITLF